MNLLDVFRDILLLVTSRNTSSKDWQLALSNYFSKVKDASKEELETVLEVDKNYELPFEARKLTYERLLEYERQAEYLEAYASFLLMFGPDWDELAYQLLEEAKELKK